MRSKPNGLVSQHMEGISRSLLERYQDVVRTYVRGRQGVYALYRNDRLYYVGLAKNLRSRLKQHLGDRHGASWNRFSVYLVYDLAHLRELETLILRVTRKVDGNRQIGRFASSEDLRRVLARHIRQEHRETEREILFGSSKNRSPKVRGSKKPVLAKLNLRPGTLKAQHLGKVVPARLRKDGSIRFNGKIYNSPSVAGAAACKRKTCNGWTFWKYRKARGRWVFLSDLR